MVKSEQVNELATALTKAQAALVGAKADAVNPFYKSNYADLASVWNAVRVPFTNNGLSFVQAVETQVHYPATATGAADTTATPWEKTYLVTTLMHTSGQYWSSFYPIYSKDNSPQAFGSAVTYARRYSLAAMAGVYQADDDANAAQSATITTVPTKTGKTLPNYAPGSNGARA